MASRLRCAAAMAAAPMVVLCTRTLAQPCVPHFSARFAAADINSTILTMVPFNDGPGLGLFAGGTFTIASGQTANRIAKWTLNGWSPVGNGFNSTVNATIVYNDGNGPALYAAGAFSLSGALSRLRIAKWTGSAWDALGTGLNGTVNALAVFDEDGGGPGAPRLFAGGDFTAAGGAGAQRLARWDGANWSPVGAGCDGTVEALHTHTENGTPALFIGGSFLNAGGVLVNRIARWNGATFSALGAGAGAPVTTLGTFDGDGPAGNPPDLIAGGTFVTIGTISANRIARWNGIAWADMGAGLNNTPTRTLVYNDGGGDDLYVSGLFTLAGGSPASGVARWSGTAWSPVNGAGFNNTVNALAAHNDGRGQRLFAAGAFGTADGVPALRIASFDGSSWSGLDRGTNARVEAIAIHNGDVFLSGTFSRADAMPASQILRFSGDTISPLGTGINNGSVLALASFNEGAGPRLFAGGSFTLVQGVANNRLARWDGVTWTPVLLAGNNGVNNTVTSLLPWNDGSGPALFAAGAFTNAGGVAAARIAKWSGTNWTALGTGANSTINALAVYNDGTGEAMYAGGSFTMAGGVTVSRIAKWNGTAWSDVGGGVNNTINALAVYAGELYAGGLFSIAGAASVNRIARWNGTTWADVGAGVNSTVNNFAVFDENGPAPGGEALFAGGLFTTAGATTVNRIARWNGSGWSALGPLADPGADNGVYALAALNTGQNAGLYMGGDFFQVGGQTSARVARWACPPCYANCDLSTTAPVLNVADFTCFLQQFAAGQSYANCDLSTTAPVLNVADFTCFLQRFAAGCP